MVHSKNKEQYNRILRAAVGEKWWARGTLSCCDILDLGYCHVILRSNLKSIIVCLYHYERYEQVPTDRRVDLEVSLADPEFDKKVQKQIGFIMGDDEEIMGVPCP